ncbi:(d)CMP kinase [soil metagenome]
MSTEPAGVVLAIDGPAGSGKSTVALRVAEALGVPHVDTGAYYRAATLAVLRAGIDPADGPAVLEAVRAAQIERVGGRTLLDGSDVEREIRGRAVTDHVSAVAGQQPVRDALLAAQQSGIARDGGVIEGRDAATRVAPDATLKVWLDADVAERARRRARQAGEPDRLAHHEADLQRRDAADARQMARHPDAVVVDTTGLALAEVVATVVRLARAAAGGRR